MFHTARWIALLSRGLVIAALAVTSAGADQLATPFARAEGTSHGAAAPCAPPPPPVRDLTIDGFYTDAAHARADPSRVAAEAAATRSLRDFLRGVQPPVAAACVLSRLDTWARGGALLGTLSQQGEYQRVWTLAGAALGTLAVRDAAGLDPAALARVTSWLRDVALAARPHYLRKTQPHAISDMRNNHAYWAGLAVGAAGIAAGDRSLLEWGVAQARMGLRQVTPEGALPEELARGRLALHYHLFALGPLAAIASLARANGIALGDAESAALDRLARFTFAATQDTDRITALAGEPQDDPWLHGKAPLSSAVGLLIWLTLTHDPVVAAALAPYEPFRDPWLGGDVDILWAGRTPR